MYRRAGDVNSTVRLRVVNYQCQNSQLSAYATPAPILTKNKERKKEKEKKSEYVDFTSSLITSTL